jgi:uncharacterized protein (TIRG00374 family)
MSRARLLIVVVGLVLSAVAIALLLRSIDLSEALRALGRARVGWLVAAFLTTTVSYYLRALRWGVLLAPRTPSASRLFGVTMVGFLAINALPARLGELVRAYVLARTERISTATVLGSVAFERILDVGVLILFWALSLPFAPFPDWFRWSGYVLIASGVALTFVLWRMHSAHHRDEPWGKWIVARLPHSIRDRAASAMGSFGAGLQAFRSPAALARAGAWSLAMWIAAGIVFLQVGSSLGIGLPFWSIFLLSFVVCLGISLPSSPGFIGVMEGATVVGLALLGVSGPEALAFALLYHFIQIAPLLVFGTYYAVREHVTARDVREV